MEDSQPGLFVPTSVVNGGRFGRALFFLFCSINPHCFRLRAVRDVPC